jgi:hypothetical protein
MYSPKLECEVQEFLISEFEPEFYRRARILFNSAVDEKVQMVLEQNSRLKARNAVRERINTNSIMKIRAAKIGRLV